MLPLRPGLRSRTPRDYAPAPTGTTLPDTPGLCSRSDRDYAPAHSGTMLPHTPGLRSRTLRDYAPAPTDSLWSVTLSPCCASCRSMVKTDLNEKDQRHIPCERNLPLASMLQIYLLYLKGFLLYVRCSVFGVRCSVFGQGLYRENSMCQGVF